MKTLVTIILFFMVSCGRFQGQNGGDDLPRTTLLNLEMKIIGTDTEATLSPKVEKFSLQVEGCESGHVATLTDLPSSQVINLNEGDKNCVLTVTSVVYNAGVSEAFEPVEDAVSSASTEPKVYENSDGSKQITLALASSINETLEYLEHLSFYILPEKGELVAPIYESVTDVGENSQVPQMNLNRLVDHGIASGTTVRDIEVVIECTMPLEFTFCGDQNILDYRLRAVAKPTGEITQQVLDNLLLNIRTQTRPTEAHVYKNGLRYVAEFPQVVDVEQEYILVVKNGSNYRYFSFFPTSFVTPRQ